MWISHDQIAKQHTPRRDSPCLLASWIGKARGLWIDCLVECTSNAGTGVIKLCALYHGQQQWLWFFAWGMECGIGVGRLVHSWQTECQFDKMTKFTRPEGYRFATRSENRLSEEFISSRYNLACVVTIGLRFSKCSHVITCLNKPYLPTWYGNITRT